MRGSQLIEKRRARHDSILRADQFRMLAASIAVGVLTGLVITQPFLKLHLGLSGHKAVFWMTPVLLARLIGRCKAGTTAAALAAAFTTFAFGGRLGGGLIGLPLIGLAGIIFDVVIGFIEKHNMPHFIAIPLISLTGMVANLIIMMKRLANRPGVGPQQFFGLSGFWFDLCCYAFFGLVAGALAGSLAYLAIRNKKK